MNKSGSGIQTVKRLRQGISGYSVDARKVKLVGTWITNLKEINRGGRIRSVKLREQQYKEIYAKALVCR